MKKQVIKSVANQILLEYNLRWDMSDTDIFEIGKNVLEIRYTNKIEKKIRQRVFAVIKWILKMKRYGRQPHHKFIKLLKNIGFYDLTNND